LRKHGAELEVIGLDHTSESLIDRLGMHRDGYARTRRRRPWWNRAGNQRHRQR
jgi:hypothetical protein